VWAVSRTAERKRGTIGMARALLRTGVDLDDPPLQRLDPCCQGLDGRVLLLDDLQQMPDQVAHSERGLLPLGSVNRQSCWKGGRGSHQASPRVAHPAAWCGVNTALIEKSWGNVQRKMRDLLLPLSSACYPLNNYKTSRES
jgi:hypothetical protein